MRVVVVVHEPESAERLSEFLDVRTLSYRRTRGKWADLFELTNFLDNIDLPGLQIILVDKSEVEEKEAQRIYWEALNLLDEAEEAESAGEADTARRFYEAALDCAWTAAEGFAAHLDTICNCEDYRYCENKECANREPTRSHLFWIAAYLAIRSGYPREAEYLIRRGLAGQPPLAMANELHWLRAKLPDHTE